MHSTLSPLDSTWVHLTLSALDPKCSKKVECTQLECTCMWWTWVDSGQLEQQSRNPQQKLWLVQWALEDSECTQIDCTQLKCTAQLDCTQVHSTRVHVVTWNPQQKPWCHYSHGLWVLSIPGWNNTVEWWYFGFLYGIKNRQWQHQKGNNIPLDEKCCAIEYC